MTWRDKARLRPQELAEIASVSVRTIWRKIESGEIPSYVEGSCRFIPIDAARRFLGEPESTSRRVIRATEEARAFVAKLRSGAT